jgi:hypothetical protein
MVIQIPCAELGLHVSTANTIAEHHLVNEENESVSTKPMLWQGNAFLFFMLIIHEYYSHLPLTSFRACSKQLPER